jgi:diketogulonate reductase-like aldo/keto reductase
MNQSVGGILLNNGREIPLIGLGTSGIKDKQEMLDTIKYAYEAGYRMLDSAVVYNNEFLIGEAIKELAIERKELFIITKIPSTSITKEEIKNTIYDSLKNFGTDYLDLLLLHWPGYDKLEDRITAWKTLEELVNEGKVLSIGVSNFIPRHLETILNIAEIKPVINQIELHPLYIDNETIDFCKNENILVQAILLSQNMMKN